MNYYRTCYVFILALILAAFTASPSIAVSSASPQKGSGELNGLKVKGDASGTKLAGAMAISFSEIECNEEFLDEEGVCEFETPVGPTTVITCPDKPNSAKARIALRLSMPNTKEESTKTFYVDLDYTNESLDDDELFNDYVTMGKVPYWDLGLVQDIIIAQLRADILTAFFGADNQQEIYLKDFSLYSQANVVPVKDSLGDYDERCDPPECLSDPYNVSCTRAPYQEFTAVANIVLAVN